MTELENGKYYSLGGRAFLLSIIQKGGSVLALMIIVLLLVNLISSLFVSALGQTISSILNLVAGAIVLITILMEAIVVASAIIGYSVSKIMLDDSSLKIVRGILSKEEISLPYRRIQSVGIKQSLLQRILGVGRLVISTTTDLDQPGETDSEADDQVIPLMDYPLASAVSKMLTDRAETEKMQIQQKP